jgi:hypothetical protein
MPKLHVIRAIRIDLSMNNMTLLDADEGKELNGLRDWN